MTRASQPRRPALPHAGFVAGLLVIIILLFASGGRLTPPGLDTPGIFKTQPSKLVTNLHHKIRDAIEGIDVIVHVADPTRSLGAVCSRISTFRTGQPTPG